MADSKLISLDAFRDKKASERYIGEPATLVWLYCPTCETLEYTEIVAPNGRTHKCGTIVEEAEVEVDLRAEFTITTHNLRRIEELISQNAKNKLFKLVSRSLDKALLSLKQSEEIYLAKLASTTNKVIQPYDGDIDELKEKLSIKEKNHLGLYVSEFRYQPEKRFTGEKN